MRILNENNNFNWIVYGDGIDVQRHGGTMIPISNIEYCTTPTSAVKAFIDYICIRRTPACILCDDAMAELMPALSGNVIELGGYKKLNYSEMATNTEDYTVTNITGDYDEYIDIMDMKYADNSIDSFVCVNVLEHIPDPKNAILEIHRCLKPGGRALIIVPFMYPLHGQPHDFYRFSSSALSTMLDRFHTIRFNHIGGRLSMISSLLQYKPTLPMGCIFFMLSCVLERCKNDCPMLYAVVVEKQ